jgi:hypothetical protein
MKKLIKKKRIQKRRKPIKGSKRKLSFREACGIYNNRFTMEYIPLWSEIPREDKTYFAPQFETDREWYNNVKFFGEEGWKGEDKAYCYTIGETWPLGESLDKPYTKKD